ncbi:endonuclease NucS domain-containing protein [Leptolyngbya sp. AN03gr2]|uniref:endonuclease NucS domain-containing protein n=1 Tax=unclassified Leptolyngbya TaxID=2650499 RepID=UPI003D31A822
MALSWAFWKVAIKFFMTKLRQCGSQWNFHNESELEDFVWTHLLSFLGLLPLKRQFSIQGQVCDILAIAPDQQLVVIELKNEVNRYVVQQLTRYYHALQQERPLAEQVDYSKPIRLIAISPCFHRDNLIDQQYNRLSVEFLQFEILDDSEGLSWRLRDLEKQEIWNLRLPQFPQNSSWTLPPVPRKLLNNLANVDGAHRECILEIRQMLLEFDERMQETVLASQLLYGKGKTRSCAEFRFGSPFHSLAQPKKLNLLLKLPHPERNQMCKFLIDSRDWSKIDRLYYCPNGRRPRYATWQQPNQLLKTLQECGEEMQKDEIENYRKLLENPDRATSVELWVEIALEHWTKRL